MALPAELKKGDLLALVTYDADESAEQVVVSRVGPRWVYVSRNGYELNERFSRDSGMEERSVGYTRQLHTLEEHEELRERRALLDGLRDAGIEVSFAKRSKVTTSQLRALLAVMQGDPQELRRRADDILYGERSVDNGEIR